MCKPASRIAFVLALVLLSLVAPPNASAQKLPGAGVRKDLREAETELNPPNRRAGTLEWLDASATLPEPDEKLMLFGQFVGDWEVNSVIVKPDGSEPPEKAEWHFRLVNQEMPVRRHGRLSQQRSVESDRQALIALENEWLVAKDSATLDRILALDFVHPVPSGDFLTKQQHIDWFTKHAPPANLKFSFARLDVRLYGDFGIVNGTVVTTDETGKEVSRNVFTDVFAFRNGRWQAINGQETDVRRMR